TETGSAARARRSKYCLRRERAPPAPAANAQTRRRTAWAGRPTHRARARARASCLAHGSAACRGQAVGGELVARKQARTHFIGGAIAAAAETARERHALAVAEATRVAIEQRGRPLVIDADMTQHLSTGRTRQLSVAPEALLCCSVAASVVVQHLAATHIRRLASGAHFAKGEPRVFAGRAQVELLEESGAQERHPRQRVEIRDRPIAAEQIERREGV